MSNSTIQQLLTLEMNEHEIKMQRHALRAIESGFRLWQQSRSREDQERSLQVPRHARQKWLDESGHAKGGRRNKYVNERYLYDFLAIRVREQYQRWIQAEEQYREFRWTLTHAPTSRERQRIVLSFAANLGATPHQLHLDELAFGRHFDEDAVVERHLRRRGETQQELAFALRQLGRLTARFVELLEDKQELGPLWRRLDLEHIAQTMLSSDLDTRVRRAAVESLIRSLQSFPEEMRSMGLNDATRAILRRIALDRGLDVWLQSAALAALQLCAGRTFSKVLSIRLSDPQPEDDLFVRYRAVQLWGTELIRDPELLQLLPKLATDPSSFVRQAVVQALWQGPEGAVRFWTTEFIRKDADPKVRAAVLLGGLARHDRREVRLHLLELLDYVLNHEIAEFPLRTAIHVAAKFLTSRSHVDLYSHPLSDDNGNELMAIERSWYREHILPSLRNLQATAKDIRVRRWASQGAECIWCVLHAEARSLYQTLNELFRPLRPGQSRWVRRRQLDSYSEDLLGRVAAVIAQDDFGCGIRRYRFGYRLTKEPVFEFRFWRLWHEMMHPSTDKRQAFSHTVGRVSEATIRAPSGLMGELSETKVPGEPLCIDAEGGWRPYLPLVDDFLSVLNVGMIGNQSVRFHTSQGVTEVRPPRRWHQRWTAYWKLTIGFSRFARLRNWQPDSNLPPTRFLESMQKLGFEIRFIPHSDQSVLKDADTPFVDQTVLQFFPCLLMGIIGLNTESLQRFVSQFSYYFGSAYENTLTHLALFAIATLVLFLGRHAYLNFTLMNYRRQIPFTVGGWGTRGKSGTERLKAALCNAMGFAIVSKSTGCEAMVVQSHAFGELIELPLFRPYDKATIWEQRNVLSFANRMRPSVLLWECMGLNPVYVNVLQRQWTRDDLSTITNTYPDHEDLQGPAGFNVAQTIAGFVPLQAELLTTEHQMFPYLRRACDLASTDCRRVGWIESGLLTDDLLDRFPYREHPDNIALVAAFAEKIGCPSDFAIKAMADEMIPDLGVLKTFPPAPVRGRLLEFTNGMSANERFGCIGNWNRLGFDRHDPGVDPTTWLSTVVNNRADRVARSRVFAKILVQDISADRHFLIGNNLDGLQGYIWEAWDEYAADITLWKEGPASPTEYVSELRRWARHLRQPVDDQQIVAMLRQTLTALLPSEEKGQLNSILEAWWDLNHVVVHLSAFSIPHDVLQTVLQRHREWIEGFTDYGKLSARIQDATEHGLPEARLRRELDDELRSLLRQWFARKLVVIPNYTATGEQIIHRIVEETPPGFLNRVMGIQNIKGPGMDFVQRWQAWDRCRAAAEQLLSRNSREAEQGLHELSTIQDFGQLSEAYVRQKITTAQHSPLLQRDQLQAELEFILHRLDAEPKSTHPVVASPAESTTSKAWWQYVEDVLDVNDALRRRNQADQIYRDLVDMRISRSAAVRELRILNSRQKGGWLLKQSIKPDTTANAAVSIPSLSSPTSTPVVELPQLGDQGLPANPIHGHT